MGGDMEQTQPSMTGWLMAATAALGWTSGPSALTTAPSHTQRATHLSQVALSPWK